MKRSVRISTLQWIIGAYCLIRGAMVLIVPHQFTTAFQVPLEPYLVLMGVLLLCGGIALIVAAARLLSRIPYIVAHLFAGSALLQIAFTSSFTGAWTGVTNFLVLGLGIIYAGLVRQQPEPSQSNKIDLFAIMMGLSACLSGVIYILPIDQFNVPVYASIRPFLSWYSLAFITSGLLLLGAVLYKPSSRLVLFVAHTLLGCVLMSWPIGLGFPNWNISLYYTALGTVLMLLPWLGPYLQRFDPALLQARVALALAGSVIIPLILAVALVSRQEEQAATDQALNLQRTLAIALAGEVESYVGLHYAATTALAAYPGFAELDPEQQRTFLQQFNQIYPDIAVFASYDINGQPIARSDERTSFLPVDGMPVFEEARRAGTPTLEVRIARALQEPVFAFSAPLFDEEQFSGAVIGLLESDKVFEQLERTSTGINAIAYVVDTNGRIIAHPDPVITAAFTDRSTAAPFVELQRQPGTAGMVRYLERSELQLAGYAPVEPFGWAVIVERPTKGALAAVHARRDRDFGVLFLVTIGLLIAGMGIARWLVRPLATLARAAGQFATGDLQAPLPQSSIAEVANLASSFGEMRLRLAERTAERDAAEEKIYFLAEASNVLAASLDYETTLQNIAQLAVSGLADYCVIDVLDEHGTIERVATAHADPSMGALVDQLKQYPPLVTGEGWIARAIRTGVPDSIPAVTDETLAMLAQNEEHLRILRALNPESLMTVLLRTRDRTFGVISLVRTGNARRYRADDLLLADELARRAALAIDNARLYREAQAAISLRDKFLSTASHELKTPLTVMLGNTQLLQRRLMRENLLGEREQRTLQTLAHQANRLSRMIGMLLDVSRIQFGQLALDLHPVDLQLLTRRVIDELQPSLELHTVVYQPSGQPVVVHGDDLRLEQVLQNLISNAIKYSPQGGLITVHIEQHERQAALAITDQGVGIPHDALPNLFHRFYRVPNVDNDRISGMGIGLYVVNEIITLHGGRIAVESVVGIGSTFTVFLPLLPTPVALESEAPVA